MTALHLHGGLTLSPGPRRLGALARLDRGRVELVGRRGVRHLQAGRDDRLGPAGRVDARLLVRPRPAVDLDEPTLLSAARWCERTLTFDARPPGY